jgi:hypothetical protein
LRNVWTSECSNSATVAQPSPKGMTYCKRGYGRACAKSCPGCESKSASSARAPRAPPQRLSRAQKRAFSWRGPRTARSRASCQI